MPVRAWTHRLRVGTSARLSYEYERRTSDQAGQEFRSHLFGLTFVRDW